MRAVAYFAGVAVGAFVALLGDEPIWFAAIAAVIAFPLAAAAADRGSLRGRRPSQAPLLPAILTALAGGFLLVLLARLAIAAPDWITSATVGCGGPAGGTQRLVLFAAAAMFVASAVPVALTLARVGRWLRSGRPEDAAPIPLRYYPLAVAASGLALITAGYVTNC